MSLQIDCKDHPETCRFHYVSDQPVAKFYNKGREEFTLHRLTAIKWKLLSEIKNFAKSRTVILKSLDELEKLKSSDKPVVVGFFHSNCELKNVFKRVADEFRIDFRFALSESAALNDKAGYPFGIVIFYPKHLHSKFEEDQLKYSGRTNDEDFRLFLLNKIFGLAGIRDRANQHFFIRRPLFIVYYDVDFTDNPQETRYWRNRVLKVANDYEGSAYFAISNEASFDQELDDFGLMKNGERLVSGIGGPMVAALNGPNRYRMTRDFSVENLVQFVEDVLAKKAEPFVKSEEEVDTENDFVKVVVAKNFDKLVTKPEKNVFILLFTPACAHCRGLSVKLDELDQQFGNKDVIFAKMDAAANDVPPIFQNVSQDKPNLYWLSKGNKQTPIRYSDDYSIDKIVKFLGQKLAASTPAGTKTEGKESSARVPDEL